MARHQAACVARIRDRQGRICGAAFVLPDGFLMTCAHVVNTALGRSQDALDKPVDAEIEFDLPFSGRAATLRARLREWHPPLPYADLVASPVCDIAVLEIIDAAPALPAARMQEARVPGTGRAFHAWGFPDGYENGTPAHGVFSGLDGGGWLSVHASDGHGWFIEPGFSGAPVFDLVTTGVLGMVVACAPEPGRRAAFVLPTKTLLSAWPRLARPYKGLDSFGEDDEAFFFGRDAAVEQIREKIEMRPRVAVLGPSGAGKSSVVLAGLLPRLRTEGGWAAATFRPGQDSIAELAGGLVPLLAPDAATPLHRLEAKKRAADLLGHLPGLTDAVHEILTAAGANRLLLVADQFEQFITLCPRREDRQPFLDLLLAATSDPHGPVRCVLTLRADFLGKVLEHRDLADALQDGMINLGPMNDAELTDAIERPAGRLGVNFEPGVAETIRREVRTRPGSLPLMSFALDQLWRRQQDRCLTHASYDGPEGIGGLEGALAKHADGVVGRLVQEGVAEAEIERIFIPRLVRLGDGTEDTRRVARMEEFDHREPQPDPRERQIVENLADHRARLLTLGRDAIGSDTAEVAHEALIRSWPTLAAWLASDREFRLWRQALSDRLTRYNAKGGGLLRDADLAEAERWAERRLSELTADEACFVMTSTKQREREERRDRLRRRVISGLAIATTAGFALTGWTSYNLDEQLVKTTANGFWHRLEYREEIPDRREIAALWALTTGITEGTADSTPQNRYSGPISWLEKTDVKLKRRFLALAFESPRLADRLRRVPLQTLRAAIGAAPDMRAFALTTAEAARSNYRAEIRKAAVVTLITLGADNLDTLTNIAEVGFDGIPEDVVALWHARISDGRDHASAIETILKAAAATTEIDPLWALGQALASIALKAPRDQATDLIDTFLKAIAASKQAVPLGQVLAAIASKVPEDQAAGVVRTFLKAIVGTPDRSQLLALERGFAPIASKVPEDQAADLVRSFLEAIAATKYLGQLDALEEGLAPIAGKVPESEATDLVYTFLKALTTATNFMEAGALEQGLAPIASRVPEGQAGGLAYTFLKTIAATSDWEQLKALGPGLARITSKVQQDQARSLADAFLKAIAATTHSYQLEALGQGLAVIVGKVPEDQAMGLVHTFLKTTAATPDPGQLAALGQGLAVITGNVPQDQAMGLVQTFLTTIAATPHSDQLELLGQALAPIARKVPEDQATDLVALFLRAFAATTDPDKLGALGRGFAPIGDKVPEDKSAGLAKTYLNTIATTYPSDPESLGQGLVAIASKVPVDQVTGLIDIFLKTIVAESGQDRLEALGRGLAALASMVPQNHATSLVDSFLKGMAVTAGPNQLEALGEGLSAIAGKIPEDQVPVVVVTLLRAIAATNDSNQLEALGQRLAPIASKLSGDQLVGQVDSFINAIAVTADPHKLGALGQGLAMIAGKVDAIGPSQGYIIDAIIARTSDALLRKAFAEIRVKLPSENAALAEILRYPTVSGETQKLVGEALADRFGAPSPDTVNMLLADYWPTMLWLRSIRADLPELDLDNPPRDPCTIVTQIAICVVE